MKSDAILESPGLFSYTDKNSNITTFMKELFSNGLQCLACLCDLESTLSPRDDTTQQLLLIFTEDLTQPKVHHVVI